MRPSTSPSSRRSRLRSRRQAAIAVAVLLFTLPSFGNVWFDPPAPTSGTAVIAHVTGDATCPPFSATAVRDGNALSIKLGPGYCPPITPPITHFDAPADLGVLPAGVYRVMVAPTSAQAAQESTLIVRDHNPEFRIEPPFGAPGDQVFIVRNATCIGTDCGGLERATITFGEAVAEPIYQNVELALVRVPAHPPGPAAVSIAYSDHKTTQEAAFLYRAPADVPSRFYFTPILFPVAYQGAGAYGSSWLTELSVANDNRFPLSAVNGEFLGGAVPAKTSTVVRPANAAGGYLLWVNREAVRYWSPSDLGVKFGLSVRDTSRQAQDRGSDLPVVREAQFGRPVALLNVPNDAKYRVTLRIYRIDGGASAAFSVASMSAGTGGGGGSVRLMDAGSPGLTFATIDDVVGRYGRDAEGPLRISVDAATEWPALWAFVSVTNNETQHVTIISPQ